MIKYKTHKFKDLVGEYPAVISGVEIEENTFFDPEKDNSTECTLSVTFKINDEGETIQHVQRFIAPLRGEGQLFQQLIDACRVALDEEEEGFFDEKSLIGSSVIVSMGVKKGYRNVDYIKNTDDLDVDVAPPDFKDEVKGEPVKKSSEEEVALPDFD